MKDSDFGLTCLFGLVGVVMIGISGWGLAHLCEAAYVDLLVPTFRFILTYCENYGRVTAELVSGFLLLGLGLAFYDKTVSGLCRDFGTYCQKFHERRTELENHQTAHFDEELKRIEEKNQAERQLMAMKEKNRLLKAELDALWHEIEVLTEPEKVAEREQQEAKVVANEELLQHVGNAYWRDTA